MKVETIKVKELEIQIEEVKDKLIDAVVVKGLSMSHPTTVQISTELDELIAKYQKYTTIR